MVRSRVLALLSVPTAVAVVAGVALARPSAVLAFWSVDRDQAACTG
jgi:hypothetical protein